MVFTEFALHLLQTFPPESFTAQKPALLKPLEGILINLLQFPHCLVLSCFAVEGRILDSQFSRHATRLRQPVRASRKVSNKACAETMYCRVHFVYFAYFAVLPSKNPPIHSLFRPLGP